MSESEAGKLGGIKTAKLLKEQKEKRLEINKKQYNDNPKYCLNCGNIIPFEKRFNKCCCQSCAASYSNKKRDISVYINLSNKLKGREFGNNKPRKIILLDKEDKIIKKPKINQNDKIIYKKVQYCKFCGAEKGKCKDSFVCSKRQLFKSLEKFGFNKTTIGTEKIIDEFYRIKDLLDYEYKVNRITEKDLKEKYNYTSGLANFHKIIKSMGIKTLSSKEANILSWQLERLHLNFTPNQYKQQWYTTWNGKEVYLRSSYELKYAQELDKQKIDYNVEFKHIKYWDSQKQEYRCAIPDFYIPSENMIVEIKSSYTLDEQNMKDKFKAYKELGYNTKCVCDFKEIKI